MKITKLFFRITFIAIWSALGLIVVLAMVLQIPYVQKKIIENIVNSFTHGKNLTIEKVKISFPLSIYLEDVKLKDVNEINNFKLGAIKIEFWDIISNRNFTEFKSLYCNNLELNLEKIAGTGNYDYLFKSSTIDTANKSEPEQIDFKLEQAQIDICKIKINTADYTLSTNIKSLNTSLSVLPVDTRNIKTQISELKINDFLVDYKNLSNQKDTSSFKIRPVVKQISELLQQNFSDSTILDFNNIELTNGSLNYVVLDQKYHIDNFNFFLPNAKKNNSKISFDNTINLTYNKIPFQIAYDFSAVSNQIVVRNFKVKALYGELNSQIRLVFTKQKNEYDVNGKLDIINTTLDLKELTKKLGAGNKKISAEQRWFEKIKIASQVVFDSKTLELRNTEFFNNNNSIFSSASILFSHIDDVKKLTFKADSFFLKIDSNLIEPMLAKSEIKKHIDTNFLINKIHYINYIGGIQYTPDELVINGIIFSNLGQINLNLNSITHAQQQNVRGKMAFIKVNLDTVYKGVAVKNLNLTTQFNLQTNQNKITQFEAQVIVDSLKINGINLSKNTLIVNYFNDVGLLKYSAKNTDYDFDITGKINISDTHNVKGNVILEAQKIKLFSTHEVFNFHGHMEAAFKSSLSNNKIEQLKVNLNTTNNLLFSASNSLALENFAVDLDMLDSKTNCNINLNEYGYIKFNNIQNFGTFVNYFKRKAQKIFLKQGNEFTQKQDSIFLTQTKGLNIQIELRKILPIVNAIYPAVTNLEDITMDCFYNVEQARFDLNCAVNTLTYNTISIQGFKMHFEESGNNLKTDLNFKQFNYANKVNIKNPMITYIQNLNKGVLYISNSNKEYNHLKFLVKTFFYGDNFEIQIDQSLIRLNGTSGYFAESAGVKFYEETIDFTNFKFYFDDQLLSIKNRGLFPDNQFIIAVDNLDLKQVLGYIDNSPNISGKLNLVAYLTRMNKTINFDELNASIDKTKYNDDSLGRIDCDIKKQFATYKFNIEVKNPDYDCSFSNLKIRDTTVLCEAVFNNLNAHILYPYINTVFNEVQGHLQGKVLLKKTEDKINFFGKVEIVDALLRVAYTQNAYKIKNQMVDFSKTKIMFSNSQIWDKNNKMGIVNGEINIDIKDFFKQFFYNFKIIAEDIALFNTTVNDNPLFYGEVNGKINLHTRGDIKGDSLNINLVPHKNTNFYLNAENSSSKNEQIIFRKENIKTKKKIIVNPSDKSIFYLSLLINPSEYYPKINVILDKSNEDMMEVYTQQNLKIEYAKDELKLNGKVEIKSGTYSFAFKLLLLEINLGRKFEFDQTYNNVITWNGGLLTGQMNLKIKYKTYNTNLNTLGLLKNSVLASTQSRAATGGSNSNSTNDQVNNLTDVEVLAKIRGSISDFKLDFGIQFPSNSSIFSNPDYNVYNSYLQNMQNNKSELEKQVAYLVIFNSFAPSGQSTLNNSLSVSSTGVATNIISSAVSNIILAPLNQGVKSLFNNKLDVGFNFNMYNVNDYNNLSSSVGTTQSEAQNVRTQAGLGIKKQLSPRLLFTTDVNLDFFTVGGTGSANNVTTSNGAEVQVLPNANLQYSLGNNNLLKLNTSLKSIFDNFNKQPRYKAGFSLSVNKEFD